MSLLVRVQRYATRHSMWRPDTGVVAAVSGGSDSVAMLLLLHGLHTSRQLRLDAVAHLNHQIRPEADDDEAFCRALADRLAVPFVASRVDVPALARAKKKSLELAGRGARRTFLDQVRTSLAADCIATAHTEDDQAETVLLRLMRGTGGRGLSGMAPSRAHRVRPVLCATRVELRRELQSRGETWREDATNADLAMRRNRLRHDVLPYLERYFNPSLRQALARTADIARADDELLARLAAAASVGIFERVECDVRLDRAPLLALPEALARRVVMHALHALDGRAASHDDVIRVLDVARGAVPAADLSVGRVEHFDRNVVLVSSGGGSLCLDPPREPFCFEMSVPGAIRTPDGWVLEAQGFEHPQRRDPQPDVAQIDAAAVAGGLVVRTRRPGDRMRPVGLGGSKKLQDLLVDRKVSRRERDAVPIVTDKQGRIVWVAGHVLGEEFRVTEGTKGVIILKLRRI